MSRPTANLQKDNQTTTDLHPWLKHHTSVLKSFGPYQNIPCPQVPPSTHQSGACCPSIRPRLLNSGYPATCRYCFCAVFTSGGGTAQCPRRLFDVEGVPRCLLESMAPRSIVGPQYGGKDASLRQLTRCCKTSTCLVLENEI
ncbi:hypothetical protein P692DRAFT_20837626 [Suillus brevipes Sb2]|nr:hypothetical protein P692DRAFT_20837626 [Suillus brevipes Sb2]